MDALKRIICGPAGALAERGAVRAAHLAPDGMRGLGPVARALAPRLLGRDLVLDAGAGVRLSVPGTPDLVDGYLTGRPHRLEPETRHLLDRAVERGDVVLDVGANVGYYAFRAAAASGPGGAVHAFEPQARLRPHLERSLAMNRRADRAPVHVHPHAVSDRDGERVALHVGSGPVEVASVLLHEWLAGGATEEVLTTTLDARLGGAPADVVKIDVEGHELAVLRGFRQTLTARPPALIVAEALPRTMSFVSIPGDGPFTRAPATPPPSRIAELLAPYGYRLCRITRRGRLVADVGASDLDRVARPTNVAFLHRDAPRAGRLSA